VLPTEGESLLDVLARSAIFRGVPTDALARLVARGTERSFPQDGELMRQGEASESMYVIVNGHVRVDRTHPLLTEPVVLAELGPGEVVGEMGLIDRAPRSATVTAIEPTAALELGADALEDVIKGYPEATTELLRTLSRRIRSTDELVMDIERRRLGRRPRRRARTGGPAEGGSSLQT